VRSVAVASSVVLCAALAANCASDPAPATPGSQLASEETMLDSAFCGGCHREQYAEWSGSMHAYASDDPVFRALSTRMQREVPPDKQTFCLQCHAPMAVKLGKATGFASLDANPQLKGVTCVFCHTIDHGLGDFNNPMVLGDQTTMRAAIADPIDPVVHKAGYSTLLDGTHDQQAGACGPCHDIVALGGAHIERTFLEWRLSRFGTGVQEKPSCAACHMPGREGRAAVVEGAPPRRVHDHAMVGVDVALTPFANKEDQRARVQRMLDDAVIAKLCVTPAGIGATIEVTLRTEQVGHGWPSGSTQDRRAWIELTASRADAVVLESGHVPDDVSLARAHAADPNMLLLRDEVFDAEGNATELFWRAARFTSNQLPAQATSNPAFPGYDNAVRKTYAVMEMPDRVKMALKIRPIDFEILEEAEHGGLDRRNLDPITTFTLARTVLEWTAGIGGACVE
jgi:hypothetical protein